MEETTPKEEPPSQMKIQSFEVIKTDPYSTLLFILLEDGTP